MLYLLNRVAHLRLVKLCREANNTYGLHVLVSIVMAFIMILDGSFDIYLCIVNFQDSKINELIRCVNWISYYLVKTIFLSWFCTSVYKAVRILAVNTKIWSKKIPNNSMFAVNKNWWFDLRALRRIINQWRNKSRGVVANIILIYLSCKFYKKIFFRFDTSTWKWCRTN